MSGLGGATLGTLQAGGGGPAIASVYSTLRWDPYWTKLAADLSAGASSLNVIADIPQYGLPFEIVIGTECLMVTARTTATQWGVNRAQRGTTAAAHYAPTRVSGLPHTIVAVKGGTTWDFTTIARNLRTREVSPGGEIEATWELITSDPEDWLPSIDARVLIADGDGYYWGGMMARPAIKKRGSSYAITCVARGYIVTANWDGFEDSRIWPAFTSGAQIIKEARNERMPLISTSNVYVVHGGQSIAQPLDGIGSSPKVLWDRVCAAGDVLEPLDYYTRTGNDGITNLHLLRRVSQPTIKIPWATLEDLPLAWEAELQRTKVVVRWSKGFVVKTVGTTPTRWVYKDYSAQIDNLDLAYQVAGQILANTAILSAIAGESLTIEYPKEVLDASDTPIPAWRIRAGWLVEFPDITAWNADLPIPTLQIVARDADHRRKKVSLQLGSRVDDDLDIAAQFTGREAAKLGSPTSGIIPQFVVPPEGVSTPVQYDIVSFGASGQAIGYKAVEEDADISTIWVSLDGIDTMTLPLRLPDIPIDVRMYVRGFRLRAHDGAVSPGPISLSVTIGHGLAASYPTVGTTIDAAVVIAAANEKTRDIPEDDLELIDPGDYLTVVINSATDAVTGSLGILVQRVGGSSREDAASAPTIISATAARDASNQTVFTILTNRICTAQIEYGPDTSYRSRSNRSETLAKTIRISVRGLAAGTHWRVHVFDVDDHETISGDSVV